MLNPQRLRLWRKPRLLLGGVPPGAFNRVAIPLGLLGVVDLLSKRAMLSFLALDQRVVVLPGVLDVTYVENRHGAMGLFGDRPAALVGFALLVVIVLSVLLSAQLRRSALAQVGFGLVLGGALGNCLDRLVHGYVIDFIALPHFYVFNLADAGIAAGLVLVAIPAVQRARA